MSRRHAAEKREVLPDAKYGDRVLTKFMNNLMLDGKKSVAEQVMYGALDRVVEKRGGDPLETLDAALDLAREIADLPHLRLDGIATHYASAASPIPTQLADQYHRS